MIWRFDRVYNTQRRLVDHLRPVRNEPPLPGRRDIAARDRASLYVHGVEHRHDPAPAA